MHGRVILRWQVLAFWNALRVALAERLRETLLLAGAAGLLIVYNIASFYVSLVHSAPAIRAAWPMVARNGLAAALMLGLVCGYRCAGWAARRAQAPWLAVLPWPAGARRRAVRVVSFAMGGALMPVPAFCGWGVSHAVHAAHPALAGCALAACFSVSFVAGAWPRGGRAAPVARVARVAARPPALLWRLVARLDRRAPRWAGLWAQGDGGLRLSLWWFATLVLVGGSAAAMSVAQGSVWPSVIAAVGGGNAAYIVGLRGGILDSAVLRASPVGFGAVWAAVARGPLALSVLWFCLAAAPAFAVSVGAWRQIAGGGVVLLALDGLFTSAVAANPASRQQALVLYGAGLCMILYQGAEYGIAYGVLVSMAAAGFCGVLWRRARRRFRIYG